jgi:hypothetical protein
MRCQELSLASVKMRFYDIQNSAMSDAGLRGGVVRVASRNFVTGCLTKDVTHSPSLMRRKTRFASGCRPQPAPPAPSGRQRRGPKIM